MMDRNTSTEELKRLGYLSARACNILHSGGINSLGEILDFYKNNYWCNESAFLQIRHCGTFTNAELVTFCEKILNPVFA